MNEYNQFVKDFLTNHSVVFTEQDDVIVIPSKNLAIKILKLHKYSELAGKKCGHNLNLFNEYSKKGIRLIQIFENEFVFKPRILMTRIKSYLGILPYNIYARKCEIREVPRTLVNKFLNKYHIQGQDYGAFVGLGIFFKNRLVAVASFIKKNKTNVYELSRFSGNSNFNVVGGASKVLSFFEKQYKPPSIISFADRRWSAGNVYFKLGFKEVSVNPPSYFYFKQNSKELHHKFGFRHKDLGKKLDYYDPNFTEWENMKNNGWDRIWDCGIIKFEKFYS